MKLKGELSKPLTNREEMIMKEVVIGLTNKEIADILFISPETVRTHMKNIHLKLGANNRTRAVYLWRLLKEKEMRNLRELYGVQPSDFIHGFIAALEWYGTNGRLQLTLYGKPVERPALEEEKKAVAIALSPKGENS